MYQCESTLMYRPPVVLRSRASAHVRAAPPSTCVRLVRCENIPALTTSDWSQHVAEVRPGHAVAEAAWFSGSGRLVRQLWMEFCRSDDCPGARLDLAAVPYFVHSQDLAKIAPLWK
eukprot:7491427-Pyramimonas_sp.AAC.1